MYSIVLMMAMSGSADAPAGLFHHGCNGCNGCTGCTGSSCHGCTGGHGCHGGLFKHKHGCNGCTGGCHGCTGGTGCTGGKAAPAKTEDKKPEGKKPEGEGKPGTAQAAPATLTVTLPAEAKLTIDGNATRSTTGTRTFVTPALALGQEFSYTLKAEIVREGQTLSTEQRVTVRGGAESKIILNIPVTSVAAQ